MQPVLGSFTSRVDIETANNFKKMAKEMDKKPAELLRIFITSFVDNRMTITPKDINSKNYNNLYS